MHPKLIDGVSLGTFEYDGSSDLHYYIENTGGDEFEISSRLYHALLKADGTKPLDLPGQGKDILPILKRNNLIQTSRYVKDGLMNRFILLNFGRFSRKTVSVCKTINAILPIVAFAAFSSGVILMKSVVKHVGFNLCIPLYYIIVLVSIVSHEVGHLTVGIAYNYRITDAGILLLWRIPIGGYVAHDYTPSDNSRSRLQFSLAGVEMNLLIAGLLLILSVADRRYSSTFAMTANANLLIALINLIPSYGLDGEAALSALLGIRSIYKLSKKWIYNRKNRIKLINGGVHGIVCMGFFSLVLLSKMMLWIVIAINLIIFVGVVIW